MSMRRSCVDLIRVHVVTKNKMDKDILTRLTLEVEQARHSIW